MSIENNSIIAFAPVSPSNPRSLKEQEFPSTPGTQIGSLIGELVDTFMYPGSNGMIQTKEEYDRIIDTNVFITNSNLPSRIKTKKQYLYSIDLLDFAMPELDMDRKQNERGMYKVQVIKNSKQDVLDAFTRPR